MANKHDGEVSIRLDKTRIIKYDLNAMAEFEDATGLNLMAVLMKPGGAEQELLSFKVVRALLWAGLIRDDPELKLREAGKLVDQADAETPAERIQYVMGKVTEAFTLFCGITKKNPPAEALPASGTGMPSSG